MNQRPPDITIRNQFADTDRLNATCDGVLFLRRQRYDRATGGIRMPLENILQAEGFVFVALVTLTVVAILDLILPRSKR
jgi:hypothetical protein